MHLSIIVGIIVIRYIILPILGVCIVKGAIHFGLVNSDHKLYQFLLLLQFAVPPATSIGRIISTKCSDLAYMCIYTHSL